MKKTLYTIYDTVSKTCWVPFPAYNADDAMRSCGNIVNVPSDHDVHLHPSDFILQAVAFFDDTDLPCITSIDPPQTICRLDLLKISQENDNA